jgi:hypothetical protein
LNTRAIEVSAYQDLISQLNDLNSLLINNNELREFLYRIENGETPADNERQLFFSYVSSTARHADVAYFQFQSGLLNQQRMAGMIRQRLVTLERGEEAKRIWGTVFLNTVDEEFSAYVNSALRQFEPPILCL